MRRYACLPILAALLAVTGPALAQTSIIEEAAAALGGRDRILAARTLVMTGEGTNGNLGQDMTPDATGQQFRLTGYTRTIDLAQSRMKIEQTRTPNFMYYQGPQPQKQILGLDGEIAYNVAPNGAATRLSGRAAIDRRLEYYHHPLTILRAALDPAAKTSNVRAEGRERLVDLALPGGQQATLAVDAATALPSRVLTRTDNTVLGDVVVETTFGGYGEVGGLRLPSVLTTKTDRFPTAAITATAQTVNAPAGDLSAPAPAAATGGAPAGGTVTSEIVAPGIWLLAGQSHHSVLVEFADHLALIEAPQDDGRTLAVIRKARELRPGKPLTQLIVTHHHFDHSGGVRAAISEGLEVITHRGNVAFFEEVAKRPHTIAPDALAKRPRAAKVTGVADAMTLGDASMEMRLYPIVGSGHTDTMLMAYFPKERVLVEADLFSPAPGAQPYAANLLENIRREALTVDRIVPIHGTIGPFSALEGAAK
ncbi:MAG: MBL fold metallo-hydrolase [Acidobacteria bacterium]|nr:MBL fold metallo-hydrolase [Acidobacteriota bacterium]